MFRGVLFSVLLFVSAVFAAEKSTLTKVLARKFLKCGVNVGLAGFSFPDSKGIWHGIDVDVCRAVAAAVLGDAKKVKYLPLSAQQRFTALQSGEVDILSRNTTYTISRDGKLGLDFAPPVFYDGQGFLVSKKLGVKSAKSLSGATICVQPGTTTEMNLSDYFRSLGMKYKSVVMDDLNELRKAFFSGRCDVFTSDKSQLASLRSAVRNPKNYFILPETISKEPLAPAVRQGDAKWRDIVTWVIYAMINAEEFGITQMNVKKFLNTKNPKIKRLLGSTKGLGASVGLKDTWALQIIQQVGNYAEIFEKNLGQQTPLKLQRGLNALWTKGGLMYAPPIR